MPGSDRTRWAWVLSLLLAAPPITFAQAWFSADDVLEVRITGPLTSVIENKDEREEAPFVLTVGGRDYDVAIRSRGKSRLRVCEFPPLRLNFSKDKLVGTPLAGFDKLKLVTHCRHNDRAETDLLQEAVAYRVLNVITDNSYRIQLLRLHYVDTEQDLHPEAARRYGLLLEPASDFAARTDVKPLTAKSVVRGALDLEHAARVFVFQYLVGNTDWSMVRAEDADECCHNIDLYAADSGNLLVPYDLDLAGVVNAKYAFPDRSLRIKRVTQRLYRGLCMPRDTLQAALRHVRGLRTDILAIPEQLTGLKQKDAQKTRDYLERFFDAAVDEAKLLDNFDKRCIMPRYRTVE